MSTFSDNLDLKDSAINGNLGALELTGSIIFLKGMSYFKSLQNPTHLDIGTGYPCAGQSISNKL